MRRSHQKRLDRRRSARGVAIATLAGEAFGLSHACIAVPDAIGLGIAFMIRIVHLIS